MKNKKLLPIPKFKNEDAERDFWDKADSSLYFDWSKGKHVKFPNLKFSTETISLRVPAGLLDNIKIEANKKDMPYQSLMKLYLDVAVKADQKNKFFFA
ncbi:MAG: BrnA antitoxin family protein [Patescibacteria group bacterium]